MYSAIGGLKTHMSNLNVIGNNIANVNTQTYKSQRMTFQESIYVTSRAGSNGTVSTGGNNPSQVGYGAQVGSIDLNMSPGTYSPTGYDLDCMIMGEGFFLVGDKTTGDSVD
ncbi:MAG: flagellar hook-basal body complex protein, partial [Oscillospiraceae bacterium]|nr:flagellar hook-basal body complex protein [Oscillospiraceae bacterium]